MTDLHLVLTDHGKFGWTIESPQLPSIIGGRDTYDEAFIFARELCEEAGWSPLPEFPEVHVQHPVVAKNGFEYLLRTHHSDDPALRWPRMHLTEVLTAHLLLDDIDDVTHAGQPPTATGERLLISALPEDKLSWCEAQLDPGAVGRFVVLRGDSTDSIAIGNGKSDRDDSYETLDLDLGPDAMLRDALAALNEYRQRSRETSDGRKSLIALV